MLHTSYVACNPNCSRIFTKQWRKQVTSITWVSQSLMVMTKGKEFQLVQNCWAIIWQVWEGSSTILAGSISFLDLMHHYHTLQTYPGMYDRTFQSCNQGLPRSRKRQHWVMRYWANQIQERGIQQKWWRGKSCEGNIFIWNKMAELNEEILNWLYIFYDSLFVNNFCSY